ncbi:hypothetical protein ACIRRA_20455 [Nocardia sp. NPDC101769]|uniref:hypothetical protein n=1 Tax=Nocardia sp. NPDC101769 TaxID=3364333 RepID=UPI0037FA49A8
MPGQRPDPGSGRQVNEQGGDGTPPAVTAIAARESGSIPSPTSATAVPANHSGCSAGISIGRGDEVIVPITLDLRYPAVGSGTAAIRPSGLRAAPAGAGIVRIGRAAARTSDGGIGGHGDLLPGISKGGAGQRIR